MCMRVGSMDTRLIELQSYTNKILFGFIKYLVCHFIMFVKKKWKYYIGSFDIQQYVREIIVHKITNNLL